MYPSHVLQKRETIQVDYLKQFSIARFAETPRTLTVARHVDQEDDSEFFCIQILKVVDEHSGDSVEIWRKRLFLVPKQSLITRFDEKYGLFMCVQVMDPEENNQIFWMVSDCVDRRGFLLPLPAYSPVFV